jgi:hypothetical protein
MIGGDIVSIEHESSIDSQITITHDQTNKRFNFIGELHISSEGKMLWL